MIVLVCGDRLWTAYDVILQSLRELSVFDEPIIIVEGGYEGADQLAARAAKILGYEVREYLADWDQYERAAGSNRRFAVS